MGRLNKYPIKIPDGVEVSITDQTLKAKGKLGEHSYNVSSAVEVKIDEKKLFVIPKDEGKVSQIQGGTIRSLVANLIHGVHEGYSKTLEISGVGYRAQVKGRVLNLQLGFSHDIAYKIPEGVKLTVEKSTIIKINGIDKELVGKVAAEIKMLKPVEPYKGKGIKERGQYVFRKEGKKK